MKLALVHDYLLRFGGAERVLFELSRLYPEAPIFTLFCDPRIRAEHFPRVEIKTSFLDRIPGLRNHHRWSLAALPAAVESFDLRDYDVVLSSASAFAKGIVTRLHSRHICYCHTPPRFLWEDRDAYRKAAVPRFLRPAAFPILHALRLWDQNAAQRVDRFLANSRYTADRIRRYYKKEAVVIPPPVDVSRHTLSEETRRRFSLPKEYFLFVGILEWWKRPELVVETFHRLDLPLIMAGEGALLRKLRGVSKKNIRFIGREPDGVIRELMSGARGLIHPQVEDFGIAAVEAMAEGTPVIAFRAGGVLETIEEGVSGEFFDDVDPIALADAVRRVREGWKVEKYEREKISAPVQRFAANFFRQAILREVTLQQ